MNYPRILLAAVAALVVFFAWGFLMEGWLLSEGPPESSDKIVPLSWGTPRLLVP